MLRRCIVLAWDIPDDQYRELEITISGQDSERISNVSGRFVVVGMVADFSCKAQVITTLSLNSFLSMVVLIYRLAIEWFGDSPVGYVLWMLDTEH